MTELFAKGLGLGFSAAAAPGPFQAVLLEGAARLGPRRALRLALVPLVSDAPIVAATAAALASVPDPLLRVLRGGGGALLLWMGAATLAAALRPAAAVAVPGAAPGAGAVRFWRAVLVNLTNPNAWLFWSLVGGPILAGAWARSAGHAAAFLAGFYALLLAGNAALVALFGAAGRLGPRAARALGLASGAVLAGLGLAGIVGALAGAPR